MPVEADVRRVLSAQAIRALGYGLGSVLLASTLAERNLAPTAVGVVLGALVAGTIIAQLAIARWADVWGRRRTYQLLYLLLGLTGVAFAGAFPLWLQVGVALTGALSAEVIESGPFTTLELSMLTGRLKVDALASGFGWYNAIAAGAGSLGAISAVLPDRIRVLWPATPPDRVWFLLLVGVAIIGIVIARRLTPAVEAGTRPSGLGALGPSRKSVTRLAGLFAIDAFAGGFVVQTFIAFWLIDHHGADTAAICFLPRSESFRLSFLAAPLIARRWGLLNTMVFTHLPSNFLLAAVAFAPNLTVAAICFSGALLFPRWTSRPVRHTSCASSPRMSAPPPPPTPTLPGISFGHWVRCWPAQLWRLVPELPL